MRLRGTAPLVFAVGSGRPAKLNGVARALGQLYPMVPVQIEHPDGLAVRLSPRIRSAFAASRPPIVVRSWPTELQERDIGVDAEPVGREETERCAMLRLDDMKRRHDCACVNGLLAIESGRLPRDDDAAAQPPRELDPVRDVRADVAVIAIEGADGRRRVLHTASTWIPIIVNGRGEATDPVDAARLKRLERERAQESGRPWSAAEEAEIESGWHVREALGLNHDRSGPSWQSYLAPRTPRDRLIESAIVRHWDPTLVDPERAVRATADAGREPPEPGGIVL